MAVSSSGFLIVAIQSQLPGYSTHTEVLLGLRISVCPLYRNTLFFFFFLYTLAHSLASFLVLPECHLGESVAVTPSLQWPLPVPLLICLQAGCLSPRASLAVEEF